MKHKHLIRTLAVSGLLLPLIASAELVNPLGTTDIAVLIGRVIRVALGIAGAASLLMFVWGGFMWLISGGSQTRIKQGKDTLIWATIGLVVIFASYVLVEALVSGLATGNALEPSASTP